MVQVVSQWPWIVSGALTAFVAYCNLPSAWILPAKAATSEWLKEAPVKPIDGLSSSTEILAGSLWRGKGKT